MKSFWDIGKAAVKAIVPGTRPARQRNAQAEEELRRRRQVNAEGAARRASLAGTFGRGGWLPRRSGWLDRRR